MRRLAAVHADPGEGAARRRARDGATRPTRSARTRPRACCAAERPRSPTTMSDDFLRATTRDDRHFEIVKELEFTSYMCVPLEARGRVLGALTLVSSGSGRRFGRADLALAEEFARRAGAGARQRAPLLGARPRRARAAVEPAAAVAARRSRARASPRGTRPRARATRSAATSTTCSKSTSDAWWFVDRRRERQGPGGRRDRRSGPAHAARARAPGAFAAPAAHRAARDAAHRRGARRVLHGVLRAAAAAATAGARSRSRAAAIRRRSSGAPTARSRSRPAPGRCSACRSSSRSSSSPWSSDPATSSCSTPTASPRPTTATSRCSARSG